jgi:hypothetical protein
MIRFFLILFIFSIFQTPAFSQTTQPATQPTASQLHQWIMQLVDDDPDVRDSASQSLMNLPSQDLPQLRAAAMDVRPLLPGQISGLHDAVIQDFLANDPSATPTDAAFLGVNLPSPNIQVQPGDSPRAQVVGLIPGFGGNQVLRIGDVIEKILEEPDSDIQTSEQLIEGVKKMTPGQTIHLLVVRAGRTIQLAVPLKARPKELPDNDMNLATAWLNARSKKAEQYWTSQFGDLDPNVSAGADITSPSSQP